MTSRKYVNVRLHRSGTQSFHAYCVGLGLQSRHWPGPQFDRACEPHLPALDVEAVWRMYREDADKYDCFSDIPAPILHRQFIRDYPDSVLLLFLRDPAAWVRSVRLHMANREMDVLEKMQYWSILPWRAEDVRAYSDEELLLGYRNHIAAVYDAAGETGIDVHVLNIDGGDIVRRLAKIFRLDSPPAFPRMDATKSRQDAAADFKDWV